MDFWWLVVPTPSIVHGDELPAGWGLLVPTAQGLVAARPAPRNRARLPMSEQMTVSLLRAVQKTATARAQR
jgi:hypothetical protein